MKRKEFIQGFDWDSPAGPGKASLRREKREMKVNVVVYSEDLTREDIQLLLQSIRDCEQKLFPQKEIGIFLFVPELTTEEGTTIMAGIKPPFKFGPFALGGRGKSSDG